MEEYSLIIAKCAQVPKKKTHRRLAQRSGPCRRPASAPQRRLKRHNGSLRCNIVHAGRDPRTGDTQHAARIAQHGHGAQVVQGGTQHGLARASGRRRLRRPRWPGT